MRRYNDNTLVFHKESSYQFSHFFLTQMFSSIGLILVTIYCVNQLSSRFSWAFYCMPIIFLFHFAMYHFAWRRGDWRSASRRCFLSFVGLLLFLPIFVATYLIVWDPTSSIEWIDSSSCSIEGSFTTELGNGEYYTIQYVSVNESITGLACVSNRKTSNSAMKVYDFFYRGDKLDCSLDRRVLQNHPVDLFMSDYQKKITKEEDNISSLNHHNLERKLSEIQDSCSSLSYQFSQVKIPNWLCSTKEDNHERLKEDLSGEGKQTAKRKCSFSYFGSKSNAIQNGESTYRQKLLEASDFVLVSLDPEIYFAEYAFVFLVVLFFLPGVLLVFQPIAGLAVTKLLIFCKGGEIEQEYASLQMASINHQKGLRQQQYGAIYSPKESSCSETERKKQKISPDQIVQFLSPKTLKQDRDFYDIYNDTRRKQTIQPENESINEKNQLLMQNQHSSLAINDRSDNQFNLVTNDHTRSILMQKEKLSKKGRNHLKHIDELDVSSQSRGQQNLQQIDEQVHTDSNIPNNLISFNTDEDESEENKGEKEEINKGDHNQQDDDQTDRDSSYLKIREIYKKKLNPKYQKETRVKRKAGEKIVSEEITLIKRIEQALEIQKQENQFKNVEINNQNQEPDKIEQEEEEDQEHEPDPHSEIPVKIKDIISAEQQFQNPEIEVSQQDFSTPLPIETKQLQEHISNEGLRENSNAEKIELDSPKEGLSDHKPHYKPQLIVFNDDTLSSSEGGKAIDVNDIKFKLDSYQFKENKSNILIEELSKTPRLDLEQISKGENDPECHLKKIE